MALTALSLPQAAAGQATDAETEAYFAQAREDLAAAQRRLAGDPNDVPALRIAGFASIDLNDLAAAKDYFARAQSRSRNDPRILTGFAVIAVREEDPYKAIALFDRAEAGGARFGKYWGERGLAYDLVGDLPRARRCYEAALAEGADPVVTRRLALNHAMSGDMYGSEAVLLPLLQRGNLPAYRTRAFALAIVGRYDEAMAIVQALQPPAAASRLGPYLRRMPDLTPAQQAAAANFGHFPATVAVGPATSPRRPSYAEAVAVPRGSDAGSRLEPQGEPLGPGEELPATTASLPAVVAAPTATPPATSPPAAIPAPQVGPPVAETQPANAAPVAVAEVAPTPSSVATPAPAPAPTPTPAPAVEAPDAEAVVAAIEEAAPSPAGPTVGADEASAVQGPPDEAPRPSIAVVRADSIDAPPADANITPNPAPAAASNAGIAQADAGEPPVTLDDAFSSFRLPTDDGGRAQGAVDITAIEAPREVAEPPQPATPPPPANPARYWVQVATGRDRDALRFDWRRISRAGGDLLAGRKGFVATWGETNRLVTGPFDSADAANKMVSDLKALDIDSFRFRSAEGEAVDPLP